MSTGDLQDERLQEALVTYEKLQDIEDDFEEVELEIRKYRHSIFYFNSLRKFKRARIEDILVCKSY